MFATFGLLGFEKGFLSERIIYADRPLPASAAARGKSSGHVVIA
jgi:hypothetical protein